MKKEKGIGLVAFIIIFVAILIIGAVAVVLFMTNDNDKDKSDKKESGTKIETSNKKDDEDTNGVQDFLGDISEQGQQNSQASIGNYKTAKEQDFTFEDVEGGVKITSYTGDIEALQVPATLGGKKIVEIGTGAFSGTAIKGIKLPDTVKTISDKAFYYCTLLVEATLGNGTQTMGEECFEGCMALTNIELNEGLTNFGLMSFAMCTSLKEIEFPKTLKEIGRGAFCMSGIEKVNIPGNVEIIRDQAFSTCSSLKKVVLNYGVKTIESGAFEYSPVESVVIPDSVVEIGSDAFTSTKLTSVNIPNSVKTVGHAAFQNIANGATIYVEDEATKAILEEGIKYTRGECNVVVDATKFN